MNQDHLYSTLHIHNDKMLHKMCTNALYHTYHIINYVIIDININIFSTHLHIVITKDNFFTDSRLPLKPSFGPGGLCTCNVFFQKTAW